MNLVEKITKDQIRTDLPEFRVGGIVVAIKGRQPGRNFIVRKISAGVGVEKTYAMNSPRIAYIKVVRKGKVRQARLYYLRSLVKQPKIKERRDKEVKAA